MMRNRKEEEEGRKGGRMRRNRREEEEGRRRSEIRVMRRREEVHKLSLGGHSSVWMRIIV